MFGQKSSRAVVFYNNVGMLAHSLSILCIGVGSSLLLFISGLLPVLPKRLRGIGMFGIGAPKRIVYHLFHIELVDLGHLRVSLCGTVVQSYFVDVGLRPYRTPFGGVV